MSDHDYLDNPLGNPLAPGEETDEWWYCLTHDCHYPAGSSCDECYDNECRRRRESARAAGLDTEDKI